MNRRSLITRIPAALLLAILPGRLTRRAEAKEVAIDVSVLRDFVVTYQDLTYLESMLYPSGPFTIRSHPEWDAAMAVTFGGGTSDVVVSSPWQVNHWQHGPVVIHGGQMEMDDA